MKNHIREHRKAQGLTIDELAKKMGTSKSQVSRLENGEREVTLSWLIRLCKALNVSGDQLIKLPITKKNAECDEALLSSILMWLMEASRKYKVRPTPKTLSKWAGYAYKETLELGLNYKKTKELAFNLVKISSTVV